VAAQTAAFVEDIGLDGILSATSSASSASGIPTTLQNRPPSVAPVSPAIFEQIRGDRRQAHFWMDSYSPPDVENDVWAMSPENYYLSTQSWSATSRARGAHAR